MTWSAMCWLGRMRDAGVFCSSQARRASEEVKALAGQFLIAPDLAATVELILADREKQP